MTNNEHRECFGMMFPDDLHLKNNQENKGKVFTVRIELIAGLARGDRSIDADIEQWDDCQQCAEFDSCYKLCLAKATLESIVASQ